jgi:hypothetical protein
MLFSSTASTSWRAWRSSRFGSVPKNDWMRILVLRAGVQAEADDAPAPLAVGIDRAAQVGHHLLAAVPAGLHADLAHGVRSGHLADAVDDTADVALAEQHRRRAAQHRSASSGPVVDSWLPMTEIDCGTSTSGVSVLVPTLAR